jgi:hypothetical protein
MSKGNTFENDILALIFNATAIANIADNAASSPLTSLYVALHTADPGEGGSQTTSEISYTGYARQAVARNTTGFPAPSGGVISPGATISFPAMSAGAGGTVTHFSIGTASSGAGKILYKGAVTPNIPVAVPVQPQLTTATTISEE